MLKKSKIKKLTSKLGHMNEKNFTSEVNRQVPSFSRASYVDLGKNLPFDIKTLQKKESDQCEICKLRFDLVMNIQ